MALIANTTLISNFSTAGRLDLLQARCEKLYIAEQVFEEIQAGLLQGYSFYANIEAQMFPFSETGWMHITVLTTPNEFLTYQSFLATLHNGEASCLAMAFHRKWTFMSDDKTARELAIERNVPVSGTIGVLISLVRNRLLTVEEANPVLQRMIQAGYYSPVTSLHTSPSSQTTPSHRSTHAPSKQRTGQSISTHGSTHLPSKLQ